MMSLNPFVENNKARINQFLNNLCETGDFYDTLEVCNSYVHILPLPHSPSQYRWTNIWRCRRKICRYILR